MDLHEYYNNKTVLVTGGVGSIGSNIVQQLMKYDLKSLIIFDNNETGLFDLHKEINSEKVQIYIGDVCDRDRVEMVTTGVDIIFHAAALKHVPLCEYNPYEAVKVNIIGTQNIIDVAIKNSVSKVIMISTDKAVSPINVMGASKYIAERLTIAANNHCNNKNTKFVAVRFGNVLNSRGSIIPIFLKQIQDGCPITITDPRMVRFVMTIPKAAELVISVGMIANGYEVFILKMPVLKITDLAEVMRERLAPKYGHIPNELPIQIIGKRIGEKLYEELMTVEESESAYENDKMLMIYPQHLSRILNPVEHLPPDGWKKVECGEYSSKSGKMLNRDEIIQYLTNIGF